MAITMKKMFIKGEKKIGVHLKYELCNKSRMLHLFDYNKRTMSGAQDKDGNTLYLREDTKDLADAKRQFEAMLIKLKI